MKTKKTVMSAMLASLICIATMVIKIPFPLGYLNLGDAFVILSAWILPCRGAVLASGIGSFLADILLGYASYSPATLVIKMLMALVCNKLHKDTSSVKSQLVSGVTAEFIMVAGYFVFEGVFLYGFAPSAANIPLNCVQGAAGIAVAVLVYKILRKYNVV